MKITPQTKGHTRQLFVSDRGGDSREKPNIKGAMPTCFYIHTYTEYIDIYIDIDFIYISLYFHTSEDQMSIFLQLCKQKMVLVLETSYLTKGGPQLLNLFRTEIGAALNRGFVGFALR